jgi:uncharacterized membrane protein
MSYEFYRVLHIFGIILLFASLGALAAIGGTTDHRLRRLGSIIHGVAVAVILIAGFGLLARLEMFGGFPPWIWIKLGIWLVAGAAQTRAGATALFVVSSARWNRRLARRLQALLAQTPFGRSALGGSPTP